MAEVEAQWLKMRGPFGLVMKKRKEECAFINGIMIEKFGFDLKLTPASKQASKQTTMLPHS